MNKILEKILLWFFGTTAIIGFCLCASDTPDIKALFVSEIIGLVIFGVSMGFIYLLLEGKE